MDRNEIESRIKVMEDSAARGLLTSDEEEDLWFKRLLLKVSAELGVDVPTIEYKDDEYEAGTTEAVGYFNTGVGVLTETVPTVMPTTRWQNDPVEVNNRFWNTRLADPTDTPPVFRISDVMTIDDYNNRLWNGDFRNRNVTFRNRWTTDGGLEMVELEYNE